VKQVLGQLQALQALDTELRTLRTKLAEVPTRIEKLKADADSVRTELASTEQSITEHRKQYKLAEVELRSAEEKIAGYSVQLYSAKTNEQYKAFLKEIETQKRLKSEVEDRMIQLMEESESLESHRGDTARDSATLEDENSRKVGVLEAEQRELESAIAEREEHRKALVEELPAQVTRLYDRIHRNKGGLAVVTTENERCNGCMNPVPPQRLLEIEREDRIYTCEACGRILLSSKK